jgi:hypothetical protein
VSLRYRARWCIRDPVRKHGGSTSNIERGDALAPLATPVDDCFGSKPPMADPLLQSARSSTTETIWQVVQLGFMSLQGCASCEVEARRDEDAILVSIRVP